MPLEHARDVARNQNLDLVEVAATAVPPVCRLLDYGKYKYEQSKKGREAKKSQKLTMLREVRLRPKISNHDFEVKVRSARKLLGGGDKVKVTVMFRGREPSHPEIAWRLLQRMAESLKDLATAEGQPLMVGRRMNVVMIPLASQKTKKVTEKVKEASIAEDQNT